MSDYLDVPEFLYNPQLDMFPNEIKISKGSQLDLYRDDTILETRVTGYDMENNTVNFYVIDGNWYGTFHLITNVITVDKTHSQHIIDKWEYHDIEIDRMASALAGVETGRFPDDMIPF